MCLTLGEFLATLGRVTCKSKMNLLVHGLISEVWGCGLVQESPFGVSYARKPGQVGKEIPDQSPGRTEVKYI